VEARLTVDAGVNPFVLVKTNIRVRKYSEQCILKSSGHYHDGQAGGDFHKQWRVQYQTALSIAKALI
jgi:hypothetical protein